MPIDEPYVRTAFDAAALTPLTPLARVAQVLDGQLRDAASAFATMPFESDPAEFTTALQVAAR
ncbi:hypothetical protein P0D88_44445 [Paraburkholderia sp. RL18-103-BIB-C]|uniref:hypothetical protein n=1 Tax=unclassified Paraburkholderia TaxID=2615204 RepID=UPI0038B6DE42